MKIVVLEKQVPDSTEITVDKKTGALVRDGVPAITNPDDLAGLEAALEIKDKNPDTEVVVMTMGLPKASEMLKQGVAMGADKGVLLTDRVLGGSDTCATSIALAAALKKVGFDLVIAGRQAIDGDTAQVGPQIAEHLGIPVISYAEDIKVEGDSVIVKRQYEDRYHEVKAKMPVLVTALSELNEPRYMTPAGIWDACDAEIETWNRDDLKTLDDANIGLAGSPTKIAKASDKVRKGAGEKVNLDAAESVDYIVGKLKEKHVIQYIGGKNNVIRRIQGRSYIRSAG